MNIGNIIRVNIIDTNNLGSGIAKYNNIVVFVDDALLDEELEVKIYKINKDYLKAKIVNIIKSSPYRTCIKCSNYNKCGGCNFMYTTYENEITIKKNYLKRLFNRDVLFLDGDIENYRNKAVFHINNGIIGFYNEQTHNVISLDNCSILNNKINELYNKFKNIDLTNIEEITIRVINDKSMVNIIGKIDTNIINDFNIDSLYINNEYVRGQEYLISEVDNYKFSIYPNSFYQINNLGMKSIYNKAKGLIGSGSKLLDLYCGTGTIGIWCSSNFDSVIGCDINSDSIKNANINKELNNINNITFICDDASNITGKFDCVIIDPPRNGLDKKVIDYLNDLECNRIVYISCNPNTLKRDLKLLNYDLNDLYACNMFPRTKHIETVCVMERK